MTSNRQGSGHIELATFPSGHRNLTDVEIDELLAHYGSDDHVRQTGGRASGRICGGWKTRAAVAELKARREEICERRLVAEIPTGARRRVLYFAAPLRPTDDEIALEVGGGHPTPCAAATSVNLSKAQRTFTRLRRAFPETTFIAPWIASVMAGEDDSDPAQREAGLVDACAVVERCDGIVLWGSRLSDGMRREMEHGVRSRDLFEVYNLVDGPWQGALTDTRGMGFPDWYRSETAR